MRFPLQDTPERFGWLTILYHWVTALTIFGLFGLGWYMVDLTYYDSLYNTLPNIHRSVGILIAMLLIVRLIWRPLTRQPVAIASHSQLIRVASSATHWSIYALIAATSVSGYLISTADGSGISVFDWFTVPATVTSIGEQEDVAGQVHEYLAYLLVAIASLHALAALKHHFIDKDATLRRMLGFR